MTKSAPEAVAILQEWSLEYSDVRVGYSRPGVAIWFPTGTLSSVWDFAFKVSVSTGDFIADISNCEIQFHSIDTLPDNLREYANQLSNSPAFDIRTNDGGKVFLIRITK